ncbi:hypothetical protein [Catelliglobosispora koreensis]|uniref:hypothetical protein n=1 Tax=Catelliglobosispora koreensis TaxID=129052 RepID=UPI000378F5B3|nr:hypothetical protein [Catelliglobosispora koreensis]
MDDLVRSVVDLASVTTGFDGDQLNRWLSNGGWMLTRANEAGGWEEWRKGQVSGYTSSDHGAFSFELVSRLHSPDEGADFEGLYTEFEEAFVALANDVSGLIGQEPDLSSEFDDPELPVPGQFDRGVVWNRDACLLMVTFQHEDKEAPLRLSVWAVAPAAEDGAR